MKDSLVSIYIDSDNGLGSPKGDIDDAFAISAMLLQNQHPISALGAVAGNTDAERAYQNNLLLAELLHWKGPVLESSCSGSDASASSFLGGQRQPIRILSLGPLTNVATSLEEAPSCANSINEIVIVGGNTVSKDKWPPIYPFEYNLTKDRKAAKKVFSSALPITLVPLNLARRLRASFLDLDQLSPAIRDYFKQHGERWFRRSRRLWWQKTVPVWDLVAAMYVLEPELFETESTQASYHEEGRIEFGNGPLSLKVISDFSAREVWQSYIDLINSQSH